MQRLKNHQSLAILLGSILSIPAMGSALARLPGVSGTSPIQITTVPEEFTGSTLDGTSGVSALTSPACAGAAAMPAAEVIYTWVAQPPTGLHIDFTVTPANGFDTAIYVLAELDDGASCVIVADNFGPGIQEDIHLEDLLVPGHRYYLYVDSAVGAQHAGDFHLLVWMFISVELQSFDID